MPSERRQRHIERLLGWSEEAVDEWGFLTSKARTGPAERGAIAVYLLGQHPQDPLRRS